ncbi:hypothetical protein ACIXNP_03750 [Bacteroides fragilis]
MKYKEKAQSLYSDQLYCSESPFYKLEFLDEKNSSDFISGFIKRGGFSVFLSTALVKICAALLSIIVVQLLSKDDYGVLSYVLSIYAIAIVVAGFGGNYSLLRFGSIVNSFIKRKQYYYYTQR